MEKVRKTTAFSVRKRQSLLVFLIIMFFSQGYIVYTDTTDKKKVPLSMSAKRGQEVWLKNNCQACHQVYGFGGFLGPDLTNRAKDYEAKDLRELLLSGPGLMPSIKITDSEAFDLHDYFEQLDKTGISEARNTHPENKFLFTRIPWFEFNER